MGKKFLWPRAKTKAKKLKLKMKVVWNTSETVKVTKFLVKISQFEFLVMAEKCFYFWT